ncbi:bifunctional indole-3-glycerol-phosphate synthase TrpC/phosphoribosylanthranilate isomerase TrpF [Chromatiaceae bacterium AAb-1]|nr:bifunctional indole-3-glycerol-phosphate synthase TrpC/phosphoribosylanthranilate isomerase TrpF [Chromatiaceae bacterium AAb-1]
MANVLDNIIAHKHQEVAERKANRPLHSFQPQVVPSARDFLAALQQPGARFILECKKASPSRGLIRQDFNLGNIIAAYNNYADCISVLTDEKFFQGSYDYLQQARGMTDKPLLCKDFIVDTYQIYLGRYCGADAVLLMLSVLDDASYLELAATAADLNMTVLTEVSNEQETLRAVALGAKLIGINNRDLRTLQTHLDTSFRLAKLIPDGITVVSESGIYHNQQVRALTQVADAFLVGSSLMAQPDLETAARSLVLGPHKVCGLTRPEDAAAAYTSGACYGGLIFYLPSPRAVTRSQAQQIIQAAPLKYVGVFVDETPANIATLATELHLSAVQLHGDETDADISQLRKLLPATTEIWKAYRIKEQLPAFTRLADRLLLDSYHPQQHGGSGITFDWNLLQQQQPDLPLILAGGLTPDNVTQALRLPVSALDLNSGLESAPGIKDHQKLQAAFSSIREFHYE